MFADLVGQEAVVKTLSNAFHLNKIAHAYLFTGPRGTGKTSAARIFAKSLNCENGPTVTPCGVCPSCIDITNGNAIDVIEIDAASNRKVEDARNLLEKVQFVPVSGKFKVYIIDEVHMLTTEAFNTLLKTLEEPPKNLVFILATTESHKVLTTIISRCQRFDFRRIKQDLIVNRLKEICEIENLKMEDKALSLIARRSGGGLRDALSLLDQASVLTSVNEAVSEKDIMSLLGSLNEEILFQIADAISNKDTSQLLKIVNEILMLGSEPVQILRELMNYFRNLLIVKATSQKNEISPLVDVSEQFYSELQIQSKTFEIIEITQIIEKIAEYEKILKASSQQHLWLEVGLISICHRHDILLIKELEQRISNLEESMSGGHVNSAPKAAPVQIPKPELIYEQPKPALAVQSVEAAKTSILSEAVAPKTEVNKSEQKVSTNSNQVPSLPPQQVESKPQEKIVRASSGDIQKEWKALLDAFDRDKISARSFFASLAKPVVLNSERIIVSFKLETFAKDGQDGQKYLAFESAVKKYFGFVPKITMKVALPEDAQLTKNSAVSVPVRSVATEEKQPEVSVKKIENVSSKPIEKHSAEQISQNMEEVMDSSKLKFTNADDSTEQSEEYDADSADTASCIRPLDLPESAKMVLDLFHGKIIQ